MENSPNNIDQLIKAKFDGFAPAPPDHIWSGIEKGISSHPAFFVRYAKPIAAAVILLAAILLGILLFTSQSSNGSVNKLQFTDSVPVSKTLDDPPANNQPATVSATEIIANSEEPENTDVNVPKNEYAETHVASVKPKANSNTGISGNTQNFNNNKTTASVTGHVSELSEASSRPVQNSTNEIFTLPTLSLTLNNDLPKETIQHQAYSAQSVTTETNSRHKSLWSVGLYITPEMFFENFDSLQILPSYTLSVEPTYYINKHFFLRFGLGFTYAHDRGFSKINYLSNDLLGTYEDVYDITFDSVEGVLVPTYYTKTTEVWDTARHVTIKEPTNTYFYVQTPLMFGYYNRTHLFNWYFYAGPAFNYMVGKNLEKPVSDIDYVEILNIDNHLPQRSNYYVQLWLGAGIEVKASKHISLSLEPNYRLSFDNFYREQSYKKALSGFALRFGFVYYLK